MIRKGTIGDAEILSKVEATCFPPNEAATSKEIQERLNVYANHFLLLFEKNQLISFIDGFCTNQRDLTDEMYSDASMHDEDGDWQQNGWHDAENAEDEKINVHWLNLSIRHEMRRIAFSCLISFIIPDTADISFGCLCTFPGRVARTA